MSNVKINEIGKITSLLNNGYTLIMVTEVTFLTSRDKRHRRRHINLRSPVSDQIAMFRAQMEELNDYAAVHMRLFAYSPKKGAIND
jgi:hypothetical protein